MPENPQPEPILKREDNSWLVEAARRSPIVSRDRRGRLVVDWPEDDD